MIERMTWEEFKDTGLLMFVNQFLHIFGLCLVSEYHEPGGEMVDFYPARTKYRGFTEDQAEKSYKKLYTYIQSNIQELWEDIKA
jgi:hypothetical protein